MNKKDAIADFHCHPSAKALLGNHSTQSVRAWQDYRFNLKLLGIGEIDEAFGDVLDSQSNLTQVEDGNGRLIFWTIYPFEKEYVEKRELIKLATRAKGINQAMVNYFLASNGSKKYIKQNVAYYQILINEELPLYEETASINRVTRKAPFLDKSDLNVVLCLEGAHTFLSGRDRPWVRGGIRTDEYLTRMEGIFSKYSIFYMTMAHIAPNGIFNHAFAGKLLDEEESVKFSPRALDSRGITNLGFDIIDKCITHMVHPDVKHLAYRARIELYDYLEKKKKAGLPYIAPIASHMGIWGIPESKIGQAFVQGASFITFNYTDLNGDQHLLVECRNKARKYGNSKTSFLPRTISLLDDDIIRIVNLGGIIGIIMDQRVLGAGRTDRTETDVLTMEDYKWLCKRNGINPFTFLIGKDDAEVEANARVIKTPPTVFWPPKSPNNKVDRTGPPKSTKAKAHLKQFCLTIIHTMDVIRKKTNKSPWKYVCFGSDYDGLIDAVNCCKTFMDIPEFKDRVLDYMKHDVKQFKKKYGVDPEKFVHHFFYQNVVSYFKFKPKPTLP